MSSTFWLYLIGGVALIAADLTVFSIYLTIIGVAAIETSIVILLDLGFTTSQELMFFAALSLVNFFMLQKPLKKALKKDDEKIETFESGGVGEIEIVNGLVRVHYNGTTWAITNEDSDSFSHGEKVDVVNIERNKATIRSRGQQSGGGVLSASQLTASSPKDLLEAEKSSAPSKSADAGSSYGDSGGGGGD